MLCGKLYLRGKTTKVVVFHLLLEGILLVIRHLFRNCFIINSLINYKCYNSNIGVILWIDHY